jgi:RNA-directed DNA polymerase
MMFAYKDDAERVLEVLGKRLDKYGLQLHPDKSRMVDFRAGQKPAHDRGEAGLATTFNFLGFLHVWGKSRKGKAVVGQQRAKDRFARALKAINQQCRLMRHWPLREQHRRLCQMLTGHYGYFGISGNLKGIAALIHQPRRCWRYGLSGRSNESYVSWAAFERILETFPLPRPRIVHRYAGA